MPLISQTDALLGAYRIDVAEIGAAIGSGDRQLAQAIAADEHSWRTMQGLDREKVTACLHELIDGGALAEEPAENYFHAFSLLCCALGDRLAAGQIDELARMSLGEDPFAVPTGEFYGIGLLDASTATSALSELRDDASVSASLVSVCEQAAASRVPLLVLTTAASLAAAPNPKVSDFVAR